jgi:hypothetical protein
MRRSGCAGDQLGAGRWIAAAAMGFCLFVWFSPRAGAVSPRHHWRTIRSGHFIVIYSEGEATIAARALRIAQQVASRLDARFDWTPKQPVRLVLTDDIALSNGFTSVVPDNVIQIYLTPPDRVTGGLDRFSDWLRLVITHEYTHIVQLGMAHGWPAGLRHAFGRNSLLFPGQFQPSLLVEGLAVHEESQPALGIGREGGALFAMKMRAELRAGLKSWHEVSMSGVTDWPAGEIPYLYGDYFYRFLTKRRGEGTVERLVRNYSKHLVPFLVSPNFSTVTGQSRADLWHEFTDGLRAHDDKTPYSAETPLTHGQRLTHYGYDTRSVRAAPDGRVFFVRDDYKRHPALMVWRPGQGVRPIAPVFTPASIDFNAHTGVLVARPEICHEYKEWFDLYRVRPRTGDVTRLTHCGRYRHAAWSPDGDRIAAVHLSRGIHSLVLLKGDGTRLGTLWVGRNHEVIGPIDWSPSTGEIVAPVWRIRRGWALEQFDLHEKKWHVLTAAAGLVGDPQYTPDGRAVLFTSDAGGVYNLRRIELDTGKVTTLTRVFTGAFSPSQGQAGGPIYYLGYTSDGYDVFKLSPDQVHDAPLKPVSRPRRPAPVSARDSTPPSRPYRPWPTLAPKYWMPVLASGPEYLRLGAATSGSDALNLHNYSAALTVSLPDEPRSHSQDYLVGGYLYYQYADRLTAGVERHFSYDARNDRLARVRRKDSTQAIYRLPFTSLEQSLTPMLGVARHSERDVVRVSEGSLPFTTTTAGVALNYDSTHTWPISISPGAGQNLLLMAETSRPFGGDFNGNAYRLDWHGYWSLGGESVLMLHYREGYATDRARPFNLGGATISGFTPAEGAIFNHHDFRFRGYPSGLAALTGHRLRQASVAARIAIARPESAIYAIGLHQVSLSVFGGAGAAWNGGGSPPRYYKSAGVEAHFDLNLLYLFNTRLTIGFAHGFDALGENQVYASLGLPFG